MEKTIITEDYCSFEIAKLLKEKGFDECCRTFITPNVDFALESDGRVFNHILLDNEYAAPTHQMAMKWLREAKGIAVIPILSSVLDNKKFLWDVEIIIAKTNETYHQGWYESYEKAVEAAIKYCLTNLI